MMEGAGNNRLWGNMKRFVSKSIIVTGAASGIGRSTALRLGEEGGHVWCVDINEEGAQQTADEIRAFGSEASVSCFDITDYQQCADFVDQVVREWGGVDVLCNIAGIGGMRRFEDETPERFNQMLDVNLRGPFNLCHVAIGHLLKRKGNIVNLASVAGRIGQAYTASYVSSKHALVGLTKSIAMEYGRQGLRANAVCPGAINTPLIANFDFPEGIDPSLVDRYNFLPWFAEPEEVAAMVAYVASDEARYVNGAELSIDGGITCG
jgi:meso-butanediol dehydrogenase/(S,S)-butanediol dehydrogenase/diacetyl reductase